MSADRTVKVTLTAQVAEYVAGMEKAAKSTRETGTEAEKLAQKKEAFDLLGRSMLAIGTVAGVAVGIAVAKFAEFDQAMSNVAAATNESASNMELLRAAALDAGARTVFSATESANAIEELGKAGVSTADILSGGLDGALDLAAAGGLGVADAAGIAAVALKTFGLEGKDMGHVADLLAAGAGKAMGDVTDLSAALSQGGQVAAQTGLSIEETTAALSAFASQGLLGSDAGTSFKSMLQRLTPQSAEAKNKMSELGISAYDAQGQFIGLSKFAGNLRSALHDLTPEQRNSAMATIFGSDAVRAATVLYSEGSEGIDKWTKAVDDQGYAAEVARKRLDNLAGDVEALGGAFDTALIQSGSAANGVLRDLVQAATGLVDGFGNLPQSMQSATLIMGAVTAAVGIAGGSFILAVPKIAAFKVALETMGTSARATATAVGSVGKAAVAITVLVGAAEALISWAESSEKGAGSAEDLRQAITGANGAMSIFNNTMTNRGANIVNDVGPFVDSMKDFKNILIEVSGYSNDFWGDIGMSLSFDYSKMKDFLEGWEKLGTELGSLADSGDMKAVSTALASIKDEANLTDDQLYDLIQRSPELSTALKSQAEAAGLTADKQNILKLALGGIPGAAEDSAKSLEEIAGVATDTSEAVTDLAKQIREFGSAQFDVERSAISFQDALASLQEVVDAGSGSLDIATEAGRNTNNALLEVASSANNSAASIAAVGGSSDAIAGALNTGRQRIIDTRIALGDSAEAASAYADRLIATPTAIQTQITLSGVAEATNGIEIVQAAIGRLRDIALSVAGMGATGGMPSGMANGGTLDFYADGGTRENHVAQIAPAGSWRVWAEPETGGEAYIPLSPSKRVRSLNIWQETGRRLGVQGFAGGAVAAAQYASPSSQMRMTTAPTTVMINAPILDNNGNVFAYVRGVAGEAVETRLSLESDRSRAGSRRI